MTYLVLRSLVMPMVRVLQVMVSLMPTARAFQWVLPMVRVL